MIDSVIEIYKNLVSEHAGLAVKGKASAYTAINGNMFSFVDKTGVLCLRLSAADKAAFEAKYGTGDVIQYGAVMRGYVPVPGALLDDPGAMRTLFLQCYSNAKALKPKPSKRKKPAGGK